MLTTPVPEQQGYEDMTLLPGEVLVFLLGGPAFPATARPGAEGQLRPRFRLAIADRVLDWLHAEHHQDSSPGDAYGEWDGEDIEFKVWTPSGVQETRIRCGEDGRYEIRPDEGWALPSERDRTVFDDLLAAATTFTLDVNTVAPDHLGWDKRLVLRVERRLPDQWCITDLGMVLHLNTGRWYPDGPELAATDVVLEFHTSRDRAIHRALNELQQQRHSLLSATDFEHPPVVQGRLIRGR